VVTGACGGMGLACSRQLGKRFDLVLTDLNQVGVEAAAQLLFEEGYTIAGTSYGNISDVRVVATLCDIVANAGPLGALVHTAGISPLQADWRSILEVDLIASERLLREVQRLLLRGTVAVLIASNAGHLSIPNALTDARIDDPLSPRFWDSLESLIDEALKHSKISRTKSSLAYGLAKRGVIRMCEGYAVNWAKCGARIVSVSPGVTWTPMARREVDADSRVVEVLKTQGDKWGTAMDIANAVDFLVSDQASFITGCDLRLDGGGAPAFMGRRF